MEIPTTTTQTKGVRGWSHSLEAALEFSVLYMPRELLIKFCHHGKGNPDPVYAYDNGVGVASNPAFAIAFTSRSVVGIQRAAYPEKVFCIGCSQRYGLAGRGLEALQTLG